MFDEDNTLNEDLVLSLQLIAKCFGFCLSYDLGGVLEIFLKKLGEKVCKSLKLLALKKMINDLIGFKKIKNKKNYNIFIFIYFRNLHNFFLLMEVLFLLPFGYYCFECLKNKKDKCESRSVDHSHIKKDFIFFPNS